MFVRYLAAFLNRPLDQRHCSEKEEMTSFSRLTIVKRRRGCCSSVCVCDEYVHLYMHGFCKEIPMSRLKHFIYLTDIHYNVGVVRVSLSQ